MRACAAGIGMKDRGNDADCMVRDVEFLARHSGHMNVGGADTAGPRSEVEAPPSDHEIWDALGRSGIVKRRTAAIEETRHGNDVKHMRKRLNIEARRAGRREFTEGEYQQWRAWDTHLRNIHFHAIKIEQDKHREKLTNRTRRQS